MTSNSHTLNRRTALKSLAAVTGSGFLIGSGTTSASALPDGAISEEDYEPPFPDAPVLEIADEVKQLGNRYDLLVGDTDQKLEYLDNADLDRETYRQTREFLIDLWRAYPTERVTDGNVTTVRLKNKIFSESNARTLDQRHSVGLDEAASAVDSGANTVWRNNHVDPMWNPKDHRHMVKTATNQMSDHVDAPVRPRRAQVEADDPDDWDAIEEVDIDPEDDTFGEYARKKAANWLVSKVNEVHHSVSHYYNPEGPQITITLRNGFFPYETTINCEPTGSAPKYADKWAKKARRANGKTRWRRVGYASHFLTDVGNPLHTGLESQQFHNQWVHTAFEWYVQRNWTQDRAGDYDHTFKPFFEGHKDDDVHWIHVSDPNQATKELARSSHQYAWQIYDYIHTHGNSSNSGDWDANKIHPQAANAIHKTGLYLRGLIKHICG